MNQISQKGIMDRSSLPISPLHTQIPPVPPPLVSADRTKSTSEQVPLTDIHQNTLHCSQMWAAERWELLGISFKSVLKTCLTKHIKGKNCRLGNGAMFMACPIFFSPKERKWHFPSPSAAYQPPPHHHHPPNGNISFSSVSEAFVSSVYKITINTLGLCTSIW